MTEPVLLFASGNATDDLAAKASLERLGAVEVRVVKDTMALEGRMILPFLQTASGSRHFGNDGIDAFVNRSIGA
jgi:hypothetical protein